MEGAAAVTEKKAGNIVSAGQPVRADMTLKNFIPGENVDTNNNGGAAETDEAKKIKEERELLLKNETPEAKKVREEQELVATLSTTLGESSIKEILKAKGIEFDGNLDALKEKLKPAAAIKTAEEIEKEKTDADAAMEIRMVKFYLENGGTAEQFAALKAVANSDLKSLSVNTIKKEMKDEGFNDEQIEAILKERYYQLNPDELKMEADEEEPDFQKRKESLTKKVTYGSKKLENHAAPIKRQAEQALNDLRTAIKNLDLQKQDELQISSKVEEIGKTLPRKMTFDLGEVNGKKIDPIDYVVTEADIAEVVGTLKDSAKRKQLLFNEDDSLNLSALADMKLRNKILETALKAVYLESGNRQVAAFEKVFPGFAQQLGVGGNGKGNTGKAGHIVSAGQPTPMTVKTNNT